VTNIQQAPSRARTPSLRELFLENPELWRNLRIELSSKRALTAGIITAVFALIVVPSLLPGNSSGSSAGNSAAMSPYLLVVLWSQKITLTLGGAISCWRAVRRERELNTYDFQRITRLSPLELAVGKLFGAPALAYFITLCLIPPAVLSAATTGGATLTLLMQNYFLLFTATLLIHAFALMISTVSDKGGAVTGVVLLLLLQVFPLIGWLIAMSATASARNIGRETAFRFYGIPFPTTLLWATLELGFAAWLLLAVVQNIKIDLEAMQLFTVRQGVGFAVYCNFVWIGFYPWRAGSSETSADPLLLLGVVFFYMVGVGVLQSRELVRRGLRETRAALSESGRLLGPIGSLVAGALLTEIVIVMLAAQPGAQETGTHAAHNLFLVLYLAAWVARDLFYLQWMKIRPVRSPLRQAFLYLAVFYVSASIVFRSSLTSTMTDTAAFAAWLAPFPFLRPWTDSQWDAAASMMWVLAFVVQLGAAGAFAYLYRQQVIGLGKRPRTAPPAGPVRLSSTTA
jgi:hypothetical protein